MKPSELVEYINPEFAKEKLDFYMDFTLCYLDSDTIAM